MQSIIYTNLKNEQVGGSQDQWGNAFAQWTTERYAPSISLDKRFELANKKAGWAKLLKADPTVQLQNESDFNALWKIFLNDPNVKVTM